MPTKNSLLSGFSACFKSWKFIAKHQLWHFFLYPIILTVVMGMGLSVFLKSHIEDWVTFFTPYMHVNPMNTDDWKEVLSSLWNEFSSAVLRVLFWILALLIYWKISKYLVLAVMSPITSYLSEKTEFLLSGQKYPYTLKSFLLSAARGVVINGRNFVLEMSAIIALMIINLGVTLFFPPASLIITPAIAILSFFISAYFYGFSMFDYILERKEKSIRDSIHYMRKNSRLVTGNGTAFTVLRWIPFVGNSIAIITCTIGAVLAWHEDEKTN